MEEWPHISESTNTLRWNLYETHDGRTSASAGMPITEFKANGFIQLQDDPCRGVPGVEGRSPLVTQRRTCMDLHCVAIGNVLTTSCQFIVPKQTLTRIPMQHHHRQFVLKWNTKPQPLNEQRMTNGMIRLLIYHDTLNTATPNGTAYDARSVGCVWCTSKHIRT